MLIYIQQRPSKIGCVLDWWRWTNTVGFGPLARAPRRSLSPPVLLFRNTITKDASMQRRGEVSTTSRRIIQIHSQIVQLWKQIVLLCD